IGLLLSVLILYGFLRNWGTTLVATLVIPVTVLVTFVAMWLVGLSFDLMTLGGVAAAIGLVIDDAIVVVENIYTHMSRGEGRSVWLLVDALARRKLVFLIIGAIAVLSFVVYRALGSEFLPEFDEHGFILDYVAPPGASLDETDRMLHHVERMLKETPEVESYSRRTGLQLGLSGVTEPNTGDFAVKVRESAHTDEVTSALRKKIESSEPALRVEFLGILSDLIGDLVSSPSPV